MGALNQKQTRRVYSVESASMGGEGHEFVIDDSFEDAKFAVLLAWGEDAIVSYKVASSYGTDGVIEHTDVALIDGGQAIYGIITELTVTSGTVCAYYHVED